MSVVLAGLILAGGEGVRFGGPKAFAELEGGRTFLEACAATLMAAGASPVVATLPPGTGNPDIDGVDALTLPEPGMDMFGSLRTGLGRLMGAEGWQQVAVLPVDHPLVRAETVQVLASVDASAIVPSYQGKHGHPICISRDVVTKIAEGLLDGPTLRDVLRAVDAVDIEVDDRGVVANCNTPEALQEAIRWLSS